MECDDVGYYGSSEVLVYLRNIVKVTMVGNAEHSRLW